MICRAVGAARLTKLSVLMKSRPWLSVACGNETANQVLDGNDSAKFVLSIDNSRQTESCTAQLLHDAIGGFILRSRYNAPHIFAQRFVSVSVEQNVQDID